MNKKSSITEKKFMSQIIRIAKAYGWICYHTFDSRRSEPGFPDLVLVRETVLFRELKTDDGKLTPEQKAWGDKLRNAGANYAVWRPSMAQEITKEIQGRFHRANGFTARSLERQESSDEST